MQIWIHKCIELECGYTEVIGRDELQKGRRIEKILIIPCKNHLAKESTERRRLHKEKGGGKNGREQERCQ